MRLTNGFITLDRKILTWEWFKDANTFRVFIYLLLNANFRKHGNVERGELVTSSAEIAKALNITQKQVNTALKHLETTGEITRKTSPQHSVIRVVNYCAYQTRENKIEETGKTKAEKRANKRENVEQSTNADITGLLGFEEGDEGKQKGKQNAKKGQTKTAQEGKPIYKNNNYIYNKGYNNNARARENTQNPKIHNFPEREYNYEDIIGLMRAKHAKN